MYQLSQVGVTDGSHRLPERPDRRDPLAPGRIEDVDPEHEHGDHSHHDEPAAQRNAVIDPVCGMTVDPEGARAKGLHGTHAGTEYFFCGKGCKLEFGDDPERFLDPAYVPSM